MSRRAGAAPTPKIGCVAPLTALSLALVGVVPALGVVISSSAWTISPALCGRSAGRFSRQRMTSAASAGGRFGRRRPIGSGDFRHVRGEELDGLRLRERRLAREHLVGEHAERVDVGAVVGRGVGGRLLGRHVGRRA